jgi:hypothetical protein
MRRQVLSLVVVLFASGLVLPATSYAQQSLNIYVGGFVPKGEDSRTDNDVLVGNLKDAGLKFNIGDFKRATIGGEWLFGLGERLDAGVGLGIYSKSVPSVYKDLTHSNGDEIEQDLKLRVVPFTFTARFLPLGRGAAIQPYIGAGVGVFAWRYSETGEFVDVTDSSIFRDSFAGSGATAGPVVLGGVGFPVGAWSLGVEIRYQSAQGELPNDQGFAGTKIDLGGFNYLASFKVRF